MSVRLHINRIVVEGLPLTPRDRHALVAAVEDELGVLVRERAGAWPARDVSVRSVRGVTLTGVGSRPVRATGRRVARAIDAGLGRAVR